MKFKRRYPIGAEWTKNKGTHFRVWSPNHKKATLVLEDQKDSPVYYEMKTEKDGYFSIFVPEAQPGSLYRYCLGKSKNRYSDPGSRFQPFGPAGPSMVVDVKYPWRDKTWNGVNIEGQILYELHVGTFTQEGTFQSASEQLQELADLGITVIELMPLNEFSGHFGWGYDGVNLFAPTHLYGTPQDVKHFVDEAHRLGLGVILDVVYNHFGPEGNQMLQFAKGYLNKKKTDWGQGINFDCEQVSEFFLTNVKYWIEEFHFDGLRVDATPWLLCNKKEHILAAITKEARKAARKKSIILIGENEPQDIKLLRSYEEKGYGFDAVWNDDFHHTALVRLTGKKEAYYTDYLGTPQEFISSAKYGFLYQGQYYDWQLKTRGTPSLNFKPSTMVIFLENHDQLGNTANGKHLWQYVDKGNLKAMTTLLLLSPNTPLLFQGQEFGSKQPFLYFADHSKKLNVLVDAGRREFLAQFPSLATDEIQQELTQPSELLTFTQCKLNFNDRAENKHLYNLHRDLITLRKKDPVFRSMQMNKYDGAVLGTDTLVMRYFNKEEGDRLLLINFGTDYLFNPAPEPLLAPREDHEWEILFSTESISYGGNGTPNINDPYWKILGHTAIVLKAKPLAKKKHEKMPQA